MGLVGRGASTNGFGAEGYRLACSRTPTRTGTSKRRRRALKNYIADGREASLIWDKIRASLRRVITSLSKLRLSGPRHQALLHRRKKVHHLHPLFPTQRELTNIQVSPPFFLLPLKYNRPTLLPSIRQHELGAEQQPWVSKNNGMKTLKRDNRKPTAT